MLTARGLGRSVDGRILFSGIDLALDGSLTWVRGPSGSGKSELLRRVANLVEGPGTLALNGVEDTKLGMPTWRARVAWVPQNAPRWPGTGAEARVRIASLASQRGRDGLDPVAMASDWGLDPSRWEVPLARLSGGEAQRLWLALVLARQPDVVLLDEPTSALDPEAAARVERALRGRTGLLVTHDAAQGRRLAEHTLEPW